MVQIHQANNTIGLQQVGKSGYQVETPFLVVFQHKADPDKVEGTNIIHGFIKITAQEIKVLSLMMLSGILNPVFRGIYPDCSSLLPSQFA